MDTIQRQSINQNLRKLAETAEFLDFYTQDYSGYFKNNKDYIYLNGEKYRPQDISPIKSSYIFTLNILDKKHDHIISEALLDIQAYEPFHEKFQTFSLTLHFLTPKERDLHCSHGIMLRTKQTHTYTYYRFIQNHFHLHTPHHDNLTTDFNSLIPNTAHRFS